MRGKKSLFWHTCSCKQESRFPESEAVCSRSVWPLSSSGTWPSPDAASLLDGASQRFLPFYQGSIRIPVTVLEIVTCFLNPITGFESDYAFLWRGKFIFRKWNCRLKCFTVLSHIGFQRLNKTFLWGNRGIEEQLVQMSWQSWEYSMLSQMEGRWFWRLLLSRASSTVLGSFIHPFPLYIQQSSTEHYVSSNVHAWDSGQQDKGGLCPLGGYGIVRNMDNKWGNVWIIALQACSLHGRWNYYYLWASIFVCKRGKILIIPGVIVQNKGDGCLSPSMVLGTF